MRRSSTETGASLGGGRSSRIDETSSGTIEPIACVFQRPAFFFGAASAAVSSTAAGAGGAFSKRAAQRSASGSSAGGLLMICGASAGGGEGCRAVVGPCALAAAGGCADCRGDRRSTDVRTLLELPSGGGGCDDETE